MKTKLIIMVCGILSYHILAQGLGTVEAPNLPLSNRFQTQIPIDKNSFTCEVFYESYYSKITYVNNDFLSELGEGMLHYRATYYSDDPRSYFSKCELHAQILDDAEAHGDLVDADVEVTRYESRTIIGCEGGSWGGCHTPIYRWVPATKVVITFQNGLELTSRGCGEILGCRD
jgi:hypothetical protein